MEQQSSIIFQECNYLQASFCSFQDMRIKGKLIDIVIKSRNREFQAHRVVLAARFPHFSSLLSSNDDGKEVLLNEVDPDVLESLINFAYEGKLKITAANVEPMFFAASCLHLKQVQQVCLSFMAKSFNSNTDTTTSSCVKVIPSDGNISDNFDEFCQSEEFLIMPYYLLKELFSRDDLKVKNEGKVFEALIKWTEVSLVERQHYLPYLLSEIRMNYLSPEYLIEKVAAEGLIKMSEQCRHIVEEAKSYHLLKKRLMTLSFRTHPRLYTETHMNVECNGTEVFHMASTSSSASHNPRAANQNISKDDSDGGQTTSENVAQDNAVANTENTNEGSVRLNVSNAVRNMSENQNASSEIGPGIYTVRSFTSVGTFVSYYDDRKRKWDNFSKNSPSDCVLNVVPVRDKLYVFFGNQIETFSLVTHEWAVLNLPTRPIKGAGIASHEDIIYVFGGYHCPNKIQQFDTRRNEWFDDGTMVFPCRNMSVVSSPKHIFLSGGYNTSCCNNFLKFHPITKKWTELPPMICQRMDHDSTILNNKIYVCGGRNGNARFLNTIEVYDQVANKWIFVLFPKIRRHSLSIVSCGNKIYAFGGMTLKENCCRDMEVYDPETNKWLFGIPVPLETRVSQNVPTSKLLPSPTEQKLPAVIKGVVAVPEAVENQGL